MTEVEDLFDSLFVAMLEGVALNQIVQNTSGQAIDYRFVRVNPAFESQIGRDKSEIVGLLASQIYATDAVPHIEAFNKVASTGVPLRFESYSEALKKHMAISVFSHRRSQFVTVITDITAHQKALVALQNAQQELLEAQRISHTGNWHLDLSTNQQVWSEELYLMLRLDPANPPPEYPEAEKLFTPNSWTRLSSAIAHTAQTGMPYELVMEMIRADGDHGWMLGRGEAVRDTQGNITGLRGVAADITERKNAELELIREKAFTDMLINMQLDTFFLFNPTTGKPLRWNESFTKICGYSDNEIANMKAPDDFYDEHDLKRAYAAIEKILTEGEGGVELDLVTKQGEHIPFEYRVKSVKDNSGATLFLSLGRDITDRKRIEEQFRSHEAELRRIAHYDTLTCIPNRLLLSDRMNQAIAQASREKNIMAVCYLDLDGFKPINDEFGHNAGDQVLIEIANRIKKLIRGTDTVARLGGDEFVILLQDLHQRNECIVTLERLLESIAKPIAVNGTTCRVSASIGVSLYPLENEDPDTLLRHADHAMYVAKQSGKNCFHVYDPARELQTREYHRFLESVSLGLKHQQFQLYYQPKIDLKTKKLKGVEALIRWHHPELGMLSPGEFLPQLANTNLDIAIGEWVVANALNQLNSWHRAGLNIEISINISGFHIESSNFVALLRNQLELYPHIQPNKLQIEVLETIALSDLNIVKQVIESCQAMGFGFALDDFGTGYSSLTYLSRLPVNALKIDQSFIRDMLQDKGDMSIVQGIIALAKTFDREIIAEGIETKEHYQALLDLGCELGQGYFISRPMPASKLEGWSATCAL